ncbi:DUF983 domain-containing protein [Planctomicrobium sp.]|nr:DUF983 domain-containing protein [Planctomicrobium sp.]MDB4439410.1 DUF983 domain-containing protein [Planctomicrobium sp.]MDB4743039.1 DUF983 domain-containing protein [Planctomicrobium sp.]
MNESANDESGTPPIKNNRPQIETLLWRGLQLKCPRCGEGKLYRTFMKMHDECPSCHLRLMREPGYYLGATYINYGITAISMTAIFFFVRLVFNIPMQSIIWPLFGFSIVLPLLLFRHARALWLAFDCQFDRSVLDE